MQFKKAQNGLWSHWYSEARPIGGALQAADGDEAKLEALIEEYPDWVEPTNRLGDAEIHGGRLCRFGAVVLAYPSEQALALRRGERYCQRAAKLAQQSTVINAEPYVSRRPRAKEAMPQPGKDREEGGADATEDG